MTDLALIAAATGVGLIVAGWFGYPLGLAAVSAVRKHPPSPRADQTPDVAVVIATRDEPTALVGRLDNLYASTYPQEHLRVIICVDHNSPHPLDAYEAALGPRATIVPGDPPGGKATALNAGVREATEPIVVFADSRQSYDAQAIERLVRVFDDPAIGGVTGGYRRPAESSPVLDLFWRYETWVRRHESAVHSVVAVTGCIYAIRRVLWKPLRAGAICDDLFVPANVIFQDHRVTLCEEAFAVDDRSFTRSQERARKIRTLTGMVQFCRWEPRAVLPWANPVFVQFLCHKLLRLLTPLLALLAGVGVMWLLREWLIWILPAATGALVIVGLVLVVSGRRGMLAELGWALQLFFAPLTAILNGVRGRWEVWQPTQSADQNTHGARQAARP